MTNLFKNKQEKGITLIALVVTIIVLLILAGISISMLTGQNGILNRAAQAKKQTEKAGTREQIQIEVLGSFDSSAMPNKETLVKKLRGIGADVTETNGDFPLTVTLNGDSYTIDKYGNIEYESTDISTDNFSSEQSTEFYQGIYGKTVNYPVKITTSLTGTENAGKWKIFYADANNIYLIADSYVTYDSLPKEYNTDGTTVKYSFIQSYADSTNSNYNLYKTKFSSNGSDGIFAKYTGGTTDINKFTKASTVKALNNDFFNTNNLTGTNSDGTSYTSMKAVASMLDTDFWSDFKDTTGYAEYAIGGPTVEMLMKSYSQSHGKNYGAKAFSKATDGASADGYKINTDASKDKTDSSWATYIDSRLSTDTSQTWNSVYVSEASNTNASAYWLASPSAFSSDQVMRVTCSGYVHINPFSSNHGGFRPLVCLNSNVQLEKAAEGKTYDYELSFKKLEEKEIAL